MVERGHILGLVLAGGLSRRMGGADKALLPLAGTAMLERVIARLRPQVGALVLNSNADTPPAAGLEMVADALPGRGGPMVGVLTGLELAAARGYSWLATAPCDSPLLPADLVARLAAGDGMAVAASGGRVHPVFALWPVAHGPRLRRMLEAGERKAGLILDRFGPVVVEWPAEPLDPFANVNTPADAARVEALLSP
ncbi:molybdenum cofactor guanylyltransferase MobA [Magnetospirillum sp. UT-4]|uniref:molybdenum cofactor guanylyltransferase MobA n=1 Tax=Magnetospirillum sp. UT-4 TaxID=2681467 RepID=UPI001385DB85|nr:molybdenum cofactor guanylyltransferase MobA [Magnetospirillum sp. UT-4]CAA7615264.1 Molybdenum cofactor guanylyltransferase [Magnetospirillum sp. UT-4]